jgi:hypothetical protein
MDVYSETRRVEEIIYLHLIEKYFIYIHDKNKFTHNKLIMQVKKYNWDRPVRKV